MEIRLAFEAILALKTQQIQGLTLVQQPTLAGNTNGKLNMCRYDAALWVPNVRGRHQRNGDRNDERGSNVK